MNFEYDSDFSGQSSTTGYSTDDSANNVIEPDDNFDLLENDEDLDDDLLNDSERKCALVEEAIIKRGIEEDTPKPKIYVDEINNIVSEGLDHEQVAAFLNLKQNQILQRAYRAREKYQPKRVKCTKDIDLDNKFGLTTDNKPFVLFDSNDQDRIIAFCSPVGLEILKKTKQIHVDGTFKSTPKIFYQTYGLHSWLFGQMFPSVYVLLGQKTERIYRKMLSLLKEACHEHGIILNFENLLWAVNIILRIDTIGLKIAYNSNDDIQFFIKSFITLSMVPLDKIDEAFGIILENKNKLFEKLTSNLLTIGSSNNLLTISSSARGRGGARGRGRGRGRGRSRGRGLGRGQNVENSEQLTLEIELNESDICKLLENFVAYFVDTWFEGGFDTEIWNHAKTIGPRTNNHVEGFHNRLNKWIRKPIDLAQYLR
ncbi:unnamed protein product, partial [Brachionus calyciflorus]